MGKGLSTMACHERQLYVLYWMVHRQWSEVWERLAATAPSNWIQPASTSGSNNGHRGHHGGSSAARRESMAGHETDYPDGCSTGRSGFSQRKDQRGWPGYATKDPRNGRFYAPAPSGSAGPPARSEMGDHGEPISAMDESCPQQGQHPRLTAQPSVEPTRTLCESITACSFCQSCNNLAQHYSDADDEHEATTCGSSDTSDRYNASCYRYGCREQHGNMSWADDGNNVTAGRPAPAPAPETESSGVFEYSSGVCCSSCPGRDGEEGCTVADGRGTEGASGNADQGNGRLTFS